MTPKSIERNAKKKFRDQVLEAAPDQVDDKQRYAPEADGPVTGGQMQALPEGIPGAAHEHGPPQEGLRQAWDQKKEV